MVQVRSRWDDCDQYGHVNNASYVALVRAAHDRAGLPPARLRALEATFRRPISAGTVVDVAVRIVDDTAAQQRVVYELATGGRRSAEVTALWHRSGPPPPVDPLKIEGPGAGRPFQFRHTVRSYELGPDGAARPQVVLHWLEHAVFRAAMRAGWRRERLEAAGFVTLVVGHHLVLGEPASEYDELTISSRLASLRHVSGTWLHEIRRSDGAVVAVDRARGAFLDLAGRMRPAPADMLRDLLAGEPAA